MQGSINWMAPEVARGKGYSAKVDLWSLGCLCLEMLTGNNPWHKIPGNIIYLLGTGNAPPLPKELEAIADEFLKLCFIIDPESRPTALELLCHGFTDVEAYQVDFPTWAKNRIQERQAACASDDGLRSSDDDDDDSDEDESSYDSVEEEEDVEEVEVNQEVKMVIDTPPPTAPLPKIPRNNSPLPDMPRQNTHQRHLSADSADSVHIADFESIDDLQYMLRNPELLEFD